MRKHCTTPLCCLSFLYAGGCFFFVERPLTHSDRERPYVIICDCQLDGTGQKPTPSERSFICVSKWRMMDTTGIAFPPPPLPKIHCSAWLCFFIETKILVVSVIVSHFPFSAVSWIVRSNQSPTYPCNCRGSWASRPVRFLRVSLSTGVVFLRMFSGSIVKGKMSWHVGVRDTGDGSNITAAYPVEGFVVQEEGRFTAKRTSLDGCVVGEVC